MQQIMHRKTDHVYIGVINSYVHSIKIFDYVIIRKLNYNTSGVASSFIIGDVSNVDLVPVVHCYNVAISTRGIGMVQVIGVSYNKNEHYEMMCFRVLFL